MKLFTYLCTFMACLILMGCPLETSFPLSGENTEYDSRLIGTWLEMDGENSVIDIEKASDRSLKITSYRWNDTTRSITKETAPIVISTKIDNNYFLSVQGSQKEFYTAEYNFDESGKLRYYPLDDDSKFFDKETFKASSSKEFEAYVKKVFRNNPKSEIFSGFDAFIQRKIDRRDIARYVVAKKKN